MDNYYETNVIVLDKLPITLRKAIEIDDKLLVYVKGTNNLK